MKFLDKNKNLAVVPAIVVSILSMLIFSITLGFLAILTAPYGMSSLFMVIVGVAATFAVYWSLRTQWCNRWFTILYISLLLLSIIFTILFFVLGRLLLSSF